MKNQFIILFHFLCLQVLSGQEDSFHISEQLRSLQKDFTSFANDHQTLHTSNRIEDSISQIIIFDKIDSINLIIDTINSRINEKRLDKSLVIAESVLLKQNYLVDGYSYILAGFAALITGFAALITILTIIFALISRRVVNEATSATKRLNERIDYFDSRIDSNVDKRFQEYKTQFEKKEIDNIFKDLQGNLTLRRNLAFEKIINLDSSILLLYLQKVFSLLNSNYLKNDEKSILVNEITKLEENEEVKEFFKHWVNVARDDSTLKLTLYKYYIENGFNNYLYPATQLILKARLPHREFANITYSSLLASIETDNPSFIISLINYEPLIDGLTTSRKKYIYNYIKENTAFWNISEEQVTQSLLNRKLKSQTAGGDIDDLDPS